MPVSFLERTLRWARRNEHWLTSVSFLFGFVDQLIRFGYFPLRIELLMFEIYLAFAALCTILAHVTADRDGGTGIKGKVIRATAVLAPLLAQLTIGGLLAGFVVFYSKSASLLVSWPFILLLLIIVIGNEILRGYREHLVFQTVLFYFSLYALLIFALQVYTHTIGQKVFLQSTAASLGIFALFLGLLAAIEWSRLKKVLVPILASTTVLTALIVGAYVTRLIPPIPLIMRQGGIYQQVQREGSGYTVRGEALRHRFALLEDVDPRSRIIHHLPGTPLYAFSAVYAPSAFSTSVVHVWQKRDMRGHWQTEATIAFSLSGGREQGYRGYSLKNDPEPGEWRILVQTLSGQTIGTIRFTLVNVEALPEMESATL
jgi:hypothetical protein